MPVEYAGHSMGNRALSSILGRNIESSRPVIDEEMAMFLDVVTNTQERKYEKMYQARSVQVKRP